MKVFKKSIWSFVSVLFLFCILFSQMAFAHGDGGSEEIVIGEYLLRMEYSENPLNTQELVLFTLSLKDASTKAPISFDTVQVKLSDSNDILLRSELVQEFAGRASFAYKFPYVDSFSIEVLFMKDTQQIAQTTFELKWFAEQEDVAKNDALVKTVNNVIEVAITDDAFEPKHITIVPGTKVIWTNVGKNYHWPASDFHPTHGAYPTEEKGCLGSNFDACEGLENGETYSFVFEELGSWSAHDHLYPGLTMQIDVVDERVVASEQKTHTLFSFPARSFVSSFVKLFTFDFLPSKERNEEAQQQSKQDVFQENVPVISPNEFLQLSAPEQREYLEAFAAKDSIGSWEYLKEAFIVDGQVIGNAHELAHIAGNGIQKEFGIEGILKCDSAFAFGCYHGVTEKLLTQLGVAGIHDIEQQCMTLFSNDREGEQPSCIHGIGHGVLTMNGGDVQESLFDCDLLLEANRLYCYDGVFMENQVVSGQPTINLETPWEFCTNFSSEYISSCANYHLLDIASFLRNDVSALATVCEESPAAVIHDTCFRSLGLRVGQIAQGNSQSIQQRCFAIQNTPGKNTCITFAAVETIFQGFSGWQETHKELCNMLDDDAAQDCFTQTAQVIQAYGRVDSTSSSPKESPSLQPTFDAESPEIQEIKQLRTVSERTAVYRKLLERVGPVQAQEELYRSGLPFTGETHLLNHAAGEYIFETVGPAGLPLCRDYFLSSCYHGFIIDLISQEGIPGVANVLEACQKVGQTTLSQCMHAVGHGFVSWVGYENLPQALEFCDTVGSQISNPPLRNCYDGVFMENVWGVHDGAPSPDRWVDDNDPLYPCYDSRIAQKYRLGCLGNTATLMLNMFKDEFGEKSGELCLTIENVSERGACFNSLARQMHPMTFGQVDAVYTFCEEMPDGWITPCLVDIATADISVGGRVLAFEICERLDGEDVNICYSHVFGSLSAYVPNSVEFKKVCDTIQDTKWQQECLATKGIVPSQQKRGGFLSTQ